MNDAPNELTAIHEAAHCLVSRYFGMEVVETWINGERGNCRHREPDDGDLGLLENIAVNFAGKVAEDRVRGYTDEEAWLGGSDYRRAFLLATRLNAGDKVGAELLLQWMERRTELFVSKLWPQIEKLAYALLNREKLSGEQIAEILST